MVVKRERPERSEGAGGKADPLESTRMSFGDHLEELRRCLLLGLLGVLFGTIIALAFGKDILEIVYRPLLQAQFANGLQPRLQVLAPTGAFLAYMKIAVLTGLILSAPWLLYQVWTFVASGLYVHERRFVKWLVPSSMGLFALGVVFLYFAVLPVVLNFFIRFNRAFESTDLAPLWVDDLLPEGGGTPGTDASASGLSLIPVVREDPIQTVDGQIWMNESSRRLMVKTPSGVWSAALEPGASPPVMQSQFALDYYVSFVLTLALAFGMAFETPLVVLFLAWSGLANAALLARYRRHVLLAIVVVAAVLTPPDVVSQLSLAVPMYFLFELGLFLARVTLRPQTGPATD